MSGKYNSMGEAMEGAVVRLHCEMVSIRERVVAK